MSNLIFANAKYLKVALLALLALMFLISQSSSIAAKPKKAKYSIIKILSTPSGLPVAVDGKPYGETTVEYRSIQLEPGLHSVVVTLPDGRTWTRQIDVPAGRIKCVVLNYRPAPPLAKSPCPFPVNISAPPQVNEGEIITYTADTSYTGKSRLNFGWTVSPANTRIVSGAGTPTISVDSTGLAGQRISVMLVTDDGSGDPMCRQTAQAFTSVTALQKRVLVSREFDECVGCAYDDEKARLDNLAVEMQNDPTTTAYVIAYAGRNSQVGQADKLLARARDYLVTQRGIDNPRIVILNGGYREQDSVELWIVPQGAAPPKPSPTIQPGDARPTPATRSRRRGRA